jgi:hypothetical protein
LQQKEGLLEKFARKQFERIDTTAIPVDEAYILNEQERSTIKRVRSRAISIAALYGLLGVVLLFLPQFFLPNWFPQTEVGFFGTQLSLPLVSWVYAGLLVVIEIYALNILNINAVAKIAAACHFPNKQNPNYHLQLKGLMGAALEKPSTEINQFGINPFLGLPKFSYTAFFVLNKIKATLSNALVKVLVSRLLGRVALRNIADLIGIPIFAFWNAWATHLVLKEATMRIMAPDTIDIFVQRLFTLYKDNIAFKNLIKDALQYTAVLKRNYNYAHYVLANTCIQVFDIKDENYETDFVRNYNKVDAHVAKGLLALVVFGVTIDGKLSHREKEQLQQLIDVGAQITIQEIETIALHFKDGKGMRMLV